MAEQAASQRPDVTVVVPVRDGEATIGEALEGILHQQTDRTFEILVVDDGCTDGTRGVVARVLGDDPRLRVVLGGGRGLSHARNLGVASARAPHVVFCDADDVPGPRWVDAMDRALDDHRLVAARLEWALLNDDPEVAGPGFQEDGIAWFLGFPRVIGAGFGVQRDWFLAIGGNDETWDSGAEDVEFTHRAYERDGVVPHFAPDAVYHYRRRRGVGPTYRQARRNGHSRVRVIATYGPPPETRAQLIAQALRGWAWLVVHLPDLVRAGPGRREWARVAGERVGRLRGSVHYRELYP